MGYLLVSVITIFILTTYCDVEISFMKGAPRLNNSMYCDYYFACHTEGEILQWVVNNNSISIYDSSEIGIVNQRSISSCNYTTTLLSWKPLSTGQSMFDSVLIVSCQSTVNINFDVVCTNGSLSIMSSNPEKGQNTKADTNFSSVILEHVLTDSLVTADNSICTNIFICGVDHTFLTFKVGNDVFGFSIFDGIGEQQEMLLDTNTVEWQAIIIGQTPYRFVVAIFVVDGTGTNVTCGYSQNTAIISSMQCSVDPIETETPMQTETSIGTETNGVSKTATTASPDGNNVAIIIGLSVAGVGTIFAICVFVICCCFIFFDNIKRCCHCEGQKERSGVEQLQLHEVDKRNSDCPDGGIDEKVEKVEMPLRDNNFNGIKKPKKMKDEIRFYETFLQNIQYIFLTRNKNTFNAASTTMTAPDIEKKSNKITIKEKERNEITELCSNVYIGMIENIPVCLVDGTGMDCMEILKCVIIEYICDAKYLVFVGKCIATDEEKTKLADIFISKHVYCALYKNVKTMVPTRIAMDQENTMLARVDYEEGSEVHIEVYPEYISPEMRTIFCFYPDKVEGLKVTKDRKAKHSTVVVASGKNILVDQKLRDCAISNDDVAGYEETAVELMSLYKNGIHIENNATKRIQVIVIEAVTGYIYKSYSDEWEFMASQAAFHYVNSKIIDHGTSKDSVSYEIKKPILKIETFNCSEFYKQVEYIISTGNQDEFDAATTKISAPDNEEGIVEIYDNVYIGKIGSHRVGLLDFRDPDYLYHMKRAILKCFSNAKYLVNVGGCTSLDQDKANLGDVLISKEIKHINYTGGKYEESIVELMTATIGKKMCDTSGVEDFILPGNRKAKFLAVRITSGSGRNIQSDKYMNRLVTSSHESFGYEFGGGDQLLLQEHLKKIGTSIEIIVINGVDRFKSSFKHNEWLFVASQAAFHYLCCKMKQF